MKNNYRNIFRTYFSDYVTWLLVVSFLFVVSVVTTIALNGINKLIYLILVAFLVIYLLSAPLLILYCKAHKDIKTGNKETLTIKISEIQYDNRHNFKNKGGATVGRVRYRIVDENQKIYLISTSNDKNIFMMFHSQPTFSVEVEVLRESRLVLNMRIIEDFKTIKEARNQQRNITHFRRAFSHYF